MAQVDQHQLTDKEKKFADLYLTHLNKARAAREAGYAESVRAVNVYKRPQVKAYIQQRLAEISISAAEVTKLISDTAQANITDYFKPVTRVNTPRIQVGLQYLIEQLQQEIDLEDEYRQLTDMTDKQHDEWFKQQQARLDKITRYQIELRRNPAATRIIDGQPELVERMELDINALVADKEKGKVKSVRYGTTGGVQVEMYSALDAQEKLAKIYGLYERDNKQKAVIMPVIIEWGEADGNAAH